MPVWGALLGTLGLNVMRHLSGKSTLCSFTRQHVTADQFDLIWDALTEWMKPHFRNGFRA